MDFIKLLLEASPINLALLCLLILLFKDMKNIK
jgi:hypothetical protein